jgi:hypothetical protein
MAEIFFSIVEKNMNLPIQMHLGAEQNEDK